MARPEGPLRADNPELGDLAADLRRLRDLAGKPTYRQLSRDAHYSAAALSEAANGRRLPSLAVTLAYVRACGGDVASWEARWRLVAERLAEADPRTPPDAGRPPYVGLAAFQVRDADRFFGRDRVVRELADLVAGRRFAGVFGASGSGKSSVLRAGLVARAAGPVVVLTPGARPLEELAVRVGELTGKRVSSLAAEFAAYPENLHLRVRQALVGGDEDLLLVVDQFEEVFTLCPDPAERAAFIAALTTAADAPTSRTRVVLGVRADFLGHCGQYSDLADALGGGQVLVGPMTADELREAVVEPAVAVGCKVETALVTRVVTDAAGRPGVLPLVSHALQETWRRRRGVALTLAAYEEAGGIEHSIARSAEQVYEAMDPARRAVAKRVFLRLIAVGEGTEDTKRRVGRDEVDHPEVLAALAAARLVVLDGDGAELAHEALIRNWPRLRDWIAKDRAGLRVQRMLTEAAHTWESLERDPGALLRGTRLALARDWAGGAGGSSLTSGEVRFLEASIAADEAVHAAEHRRTRRLRQLVSVMGVALLVAFAATVFAFRAERSATEQAHIALAHKVVTQAAGLRDSDPALSLQLSLAAHQLAPLVETRDALFGAFGEPYAAVMSAVRTAAADPTGALLAVVDDSTGGARLVDITDPLRPARLATLDGVGGVRALAFAPGGKRVAAAGAGVVGVWDVDDPRHPEQMLEPADPAVGDAAVSLAFSPDGEYLVAGYEHRPPAAWRVRTGAPASVPPAVTTSPAVAFLSADVVAVASGDEVHAVDLRTGTSSVLVSGVGAFTALAASDDGTLLVTAADDLVVRLWRITDPRGPAVAAAVLRHGGEVRGLGLTAGGRVLATTGEERYTRLFDVVDRSTPVEITALDGHLGPVASAGFASGDAVLVTTGDDMTVRLVDVTDLPFAQAGVVRSLVVAAGRGRAATIDQEGVLRLVDISEPRGLRIARPLHAHQGEVLAAALSPDGEHLVTVAEDGPVRVWRTTDPSGPVLVGEAGTARTVAFGPSGTHFATGDADGRTRLWDVRTLASASAFTGELAGAFPVTALAFDDTGDRLVVAKSNGWTEEWDVSSVDAPRQVVSNGTGSQVVSVEVASGGRLVTVERGRNAALWRDATTTPDGGDARVVLGTEVRDAAARGDRAAVAGADGNVRLYALSGKGALQPLTVFAAHPTGVNAVAFAPDGRTLISAGGTELRFWETDLDRVMARICATAHPRITFEQWVVYFPGVPYDPPCANP